MAPGYYWARDRAQSLDGWKIVEVHDDCVWVCGSEVCSEPAVWDFGPRVNGQNYDDYAVKGQDADSEA